MVRIMRVTRLIVRCGMAGALIGLAAGLLEAARLSFFPRAPLLVTEVRPVIPSAA